MIVRGRIRALLLMLAACEPSPPSPPSPPSTPSTPSSTPPASAPRSAADAAPPGDAPGKVVVTESDECGFLLDQVYFEPDSSTLRAHQLPIVDETASMFRCFLRTGEITRWQVVGNADAAERDPAKLSLARARVVADALVARGVGATSLDVTGAGTTQPMDRRRTPSARAKNRRVFFLVLERKTSSP